MTHQFTDNLFLKAFINETPDAIMIFNESGELLCWNHCQEKITGYCFEELKHKKIWDIQWMLSQDEDKERNSVNDLKNNLTNRLNPFNEKKLRAQNEIFIRTKNGDSVYIQQSVFPLILGGDKFLISIIRDKTSEHKLQADLKISEEKYRRVFELSTDPMMILENGKFIECNKAALVMLGFNKKEDLLGKTPWEISPEYQSDGNSSEKMAQYVIDEAINQGFNIFEWKHKNTNNDEIWFLISLTPIPIDQGYRIHCNMKNIHKQKLNEDKLVKYQSNLEEIIKERTTELEEKNKQLERMNNVFVGREFRIKELKNRIKELEAKLDSLESS